MSADSKDMPIRRATTMGSGEDAIPDADPSTTAGLLAERVKAWKHAVVDLEGYMEATEKVHRAHAKEYEKVLKTISQPLREGRHFDQGLGGVAGFFENMRVNTQAMINSNTETEKTIKGTILPMLDRLHKEIKAKEKEVANSATKSAKEVEKARNTTQKHIELLGQHSASFESAGGRFEPSTDPYVLQRGVFYRLNRQVIEENNHRNDLINVQNSLQSFEAHVLQAIQAAMEAFNQVVGGQAEKIRALYSDMLGAAQCIPNNFEWINFLSREQSKLVDPNEVPRSVDSITFPNQDHASTKPLIAGSLERKSRNKLAWGTQSGFYVVTPAKYLHEFKDEDNFRHDPKPELSIYLPDAVIAAPSGDKFSVKGKDKGKSISSKLAGAAELNFKAHTAADAQKWFEALKIAAGGTTTYDSTPSSPVVASSAESTPPPEKPTVATSPAAISHKEQEAGITGGNTVTSPTAISPASPVVASGKGSAVASPVATPVEEKKLAPA